MDALELKTRAGRFTFVGRLNLDDRRAPGVLVVNGSFPNREYLRDYPVAFEDASVLVGYLPGWWGTAWEGGTVEGVAEALGEIVDQLLDDRPLVVVGASTGNLAALALQRPTIRRRIAIEPFFQTKDLWPFIRYTQGYMREKPVDVSTPRYLWDLFGIGLDHVENRDYRYLLDRITVPTDVLVGQAPLMPPREINGWPSLTPQEDQEALAAHPMVTLHKGPPASGHAVNVKGEGARQAKALVRAALDAVKLTDS